MMLYAQPTAYPANSTSIRVLDDGLVCWLLFFSQAKAELRALVSMKLSSYRLVSYYHVRSAINNTLKNIIQSLWNHNKTNKIEKNYPLSLSNILKNPTICKTYIQALPVDEIFSCGLIFHRDDTGNCLNAPWSLHWCPSKCSFRNFQQGAPALPETRHTGLLITCNDCFLTKC